MKKYYHCKALEKRGTCEHFQIMENGKCVAMWVFEFVWERVDSLGDNDNEVYKEAVELTEKEFKALQFQRML